jgi:hypothetical protein
MDALELLPEPHESLTAGNETLHPCVGSFLKRQENKNPATGNRVKFSAMAEDRQSNSRSLDAGHK